MKHKKRSSAPGLDLEAARAVPIHLGEYRRLHLVLAGCGGTGSWLAPTLARLARVLRDERHLDVRLTFIDPDQVEARNTVRQNFCAAEVGRPKALALAARYSLAWGLEVEAVQAPFGQELIRTSGGGWAERVVLVGCVDNAAARRTLHEALEAPAAGHVPRVWWLDCGNGYTGGQVLLGSGRRPSDLADAFRLPTVCAALPSPAWQRPELLKPAPEELNGSSLDCAEIARRNVQSLTINPVIASVAADYLNGLLLGGLRCFATYISLQAKTMRSRYTTPESMAEVARIKVNGLTAAQDDEANSRN